MKTFTFRYEKSPRTSAKKALLRASESGIANIKEDEMLCASMEEMQKLMSKSRAEVFAAIVEQQPDSLYDLSKKMKKDQSNVLRDAKALESIGLIELKIVKVGERERMKPIPLYDRIIFEFQPRKHAKAG